ncbi:MAG: 4Fe-4S dicluster domain-containing protein [Firmicutes bacterium]|nr:4Fe-4S dicluster domain-containing protein [Bacillota bacterium]
MPTISLSKETSQEFPQDVATRSGTDPSACYQCGKCSAGCPVAFAMDHGPRRVMRLVQLGARDLALRNSTIWLCACCETCTMRCPRNIEVARVMETLRIMASELGIDSPVSTVPLFNKLFLGSVKGRGRVYEFLTALRFNLSSGKPLKDSSLGREMLRRGKLVLKPPGIRGRREVARIFEACEAHSYHGR